MPPAVTLTPDVCGRIPLQLEAEAKLYEIIRSANTQVTFRACQSIASQPHLGRYVHQFCFVPDARRTHDIPEQFWAMLQLALGWVLSDLARIPFQLFEARLLFYWDAHLVKFLESQNKLKSLHTIEGPIDDPALHLEAGSLPELRIYDGPLAAAEHIVHVGSALTHLQVVLDKNSEVDLLAFIPKLSHLASSLRALSILHLPESISIDAFRSITKACPQLRHIGTIPLPLPRNSYRFHGALMALRQLQVLEVDVTSWSPPAKGLLQRAIAADIRIYTPLIEYICFWAGTTRTLWGLDGNDWSCHSESGQHSQFDALWKTR
ncbi:hypothetical protein JVU11DRAFT_3137 [Chiua virens]|nr:hypothetical protein JVU11DRAFT_3137 [Chiua virens]